MNDRVGACIAIILACLVVQISMLSNRVGGAIDNHSQCAQETANE